MTSPLQFWTLFICCIKLQAIANHANESCLTTYQISEWKRSAAYADTNSLCDYLLHEGWYRVTSGAGEKMPTECPTFGYRCGTADPFYLSREDIVDPSEQTFPKDGQTVDRVACSADMYGNCCKERINIKIKNCGNYFVYYLKPTKTCPSSYCFGENLPCPEGESSENGFSPGCGKYPNIIMPPPKITTGLHKRNSTVDEKYNNTHHTVQFQCNSNGSTYYTYDVRWYINDFEITNAAHYDVPGNNLSYVTMLHQHHWEKNFKPNMMVKCSVQVRSINFTSPGPRSYSANFFAGIKVDQSNFQIKEGDVNVSAGPIVLTIPIGCVHPQEHNKTEAIIRNTCVLQLLAGVPTYQNDNNYCGGMTELNDQALRFNAQGCGVHFPHTDWQTPKYVLVSAASDHTVTVSKRLTILQLYQDGTGTSGIKELDIWKGFMLQEMKFEVIDTDEVTLGSTCQSNNDPHMVTFDGKRYELQKTAGEYVMFQHKKLPIKIHSFYQRCHNIRGPLCNCGAAIRSGNSLFVANFCSKNRSVKHFICDENDITVKEKSNGYYVTVSSGTELDISIGPVYNFYGINHFHLKGSSLDYNFTDGLCGTYNKNRKDDFTLKDENENTNADIFAESWRIKDNASSLFNAEVLLPIEFEGREYCSCKTVTNSFPFGPPIIDCNLTKAMLPCQELTQSVFPAPCKRHKTYERRKRSLEYLDDEEPKDIEIPLDDPDSGDPDMSWKNKWTMEKALQHCETAFVSTASFAVCKDHVPSIPSENFINDCVLDIQITGDTQWVDVSTDNYASACLGEAKKMENLTRANVSEDDGAESIFDLIESSTCPKNCSGNGICGNGQCNCTNGYFGSDCSIEKSQSPVLALDAFNGICDTSSRRCQSYIVPGHNFFKGSLICRFRPFKIILNETVDGGGTEELPGKYFGPFYMHCPAPASRRKRSATDEGFALGYRLSVSNDGGNFTQELTILIYNALCLYCNITSLECIELDTCPVYLVPIVVINSDNKTPLIAGLCGSFATLAILLLIVIVAKKYSKRSNKTEPTIASTAHIKTAY